VLAGQRLKTLRSGRNVTVREVEHASRRIAEAKGDRRFCISNGWLAQLENGASEPSICKLFSLSVIYRVNFLDLARLYVDVNEKEKYERIADPYLTQLLGETGNDSFPAASSGRCAELATRLAPASERRDFGQREDRKPNIIYGHVGLADFTMYPMIRPSAVLKIDTTQTRLTTAAWRNEYERPIFFIELRQAYACGWCELQGNELLIIPHHSSPSTVRQFTYPREAEIVGRVIGYSTPCVEHEANSGKVAKAK